MEEQYAYELVIDRTEWFRGDYGSKLLRYDGKKCCLGFDCLLAGLSEDDILGFPVPRWDWFSKIEETRRTDLEKLFDSDSTFIQTAMALNDSALGKDIILIGTLSGCQIKLPPLSSEEDREERLTKLFLEERNVKLTFIN